jgi:ATP-binding cassette subfamily B multidrug efflux pump
MFRYFERLIDPVATPSGVSPPAGTLAFYWHFIRQHKPVFAALVVIQFLLASFDAALPVFVGMIVNRLAGADPASFFSDNWALLTMMAVVILVLRPLTLSAQFLISQQALAPGFSSMVRWQSHWHVARQGWSFFQNDFVGRIANRVMNTANSLRESVVSSIRAIWYIIVYGVTTLALMAANQSRRMSIRQIVVLHGCHEPMVRQQLHHSRLQKNQLME